jgi:hypothetical protein
VDACRLLKEVNTPLTSRVSGIRETRARSSISKLMKRREAKSVGDKPSRWSCVEGTDKRRSVLVSAFRISQDLEERVGSFNSRNRE